MTRGPRTRATPPPADELPALHDLWRRNHFVVLPGLLEASLLAFVRSHVAIGEFFDFQHRASGHEACMRSNAAVWLLDFLMNAPELLRVVESITGIDRIGWFDGRIYRLTPGTDEGHHWHDDNTHGRKLGVSVNLIDTPFEGGLLQLRDSQTCAALAEVANTGEGDCVIFRLGDDLEHRVLPVTGSVPRIAFAGWFREGETHAEWIKQVYLRRPVPSR